MLLESAKSLIQEIIGPRPRSFAGCRVSRRGSGADQGIQTPEPAVDGILDRNEENCQEWTPMVEEIEINCPYLPTNGIGRHGSLVKGLRWFCAYLVYGFLSNFMFYILPMQMKRSTMNKIDKTAIILIGFQNDYFHPEGILTGA